ncbi:MAG: hypothetical protein Kow0077_06250 [Anaerolineae bacterium]
MLRLPVIYVFILPFAIAIVACTPVNLPDPDEITAGLPPVVTLPPVPAADDPVALCAAAKQVEAVDVGRAIELLEQVRMLGAACPDDQGLQDTLYRLLVTQAQTHIAYGETQQADALLRRAVQLLPGASAAVRDSAEAPRDHCTASAIEAAYAAMTPWQAAASSEFVMVQDGQLLAGGQPFAVQGVNYSPVGVRSVQDWAQVRPDQVSRELGMILAAGFNTVRLVVPLDGLFQCSGNGAVPLPSGFEALDDLLRLIAAQDLRVVMRLELAATPAMVADRQASTQFAQLRYVAERYRAEPAILAWDIGGGEALAGTGQNARLTWLAYAGQALRAGDERHPVMASRESGELDTLPFVDVVGLSHRDSTVALRVRIAAVRQQTQKPVLVAALGYDSALMPETRQGQYLREGVEAALEGGAVGWLVWQAFDRESAGELFGLWRADYEPKVALGLLQILMRGNQPGVGEQETG